MHRFRVFSLLSCLALLALLAPSMALAGPPDDGARTVAVVSLTAVRDRAGDVSGLEPFAAALELPTWLESMAKLYVRADEVPSIDARRPWGAVLQSTGRGVRAWGILPVSDPEALADDLREYIWSVTDAGGGVWRVEGTSAADRLYARLLPGGWLAVSADAETLAAVPEDAARELGNLPKTYDMAIRFDVSRVPSRVGGALLSRVRELLESSRAARRGGLSEAKRSAIIEALSYLEAITLGWNRHES